MWNAAIVAIVVRAPVRIADLGGWTDTWFASHGIVSNVAVSPGVEVRIQRDQAHQLPPNHIRLCSLDSELIVSRDTASWDDRFLAALFGPVAPDGISLTIASGVPAGSGLGTSASVAVAVLAALDVLAGRPIDQLELAHRAHQREVSSGRQSGVQDHGAAALGGVRRWRIAYPDFSWSDPVTDPSVLASLNERLLVVYLGAPHVSSEIHEMVIRELESSASLNNEDDRMEPLRAAAAMGHGALENGDFATYGKAMVACHEGQRRLHSGLVSDLADHVVSAVALAGAVGWKVNGAGGEGGTLTILSRDVQNSAELAHVVGKINGAEVLGLQLDLLGVRVEQDDPMIGELPRRRVTLEG
jgi:D-glycero-alpha-D-manno-heptose-7-phosphate kinase